MNEEGMEMIKTFTNKKDGLSVAIMTGNERHAYRCVFKDTDSDETVYIVFSNNLGSLIAKAKGFIGEEIE